MSKTTDLTEITTLADTDLFMVVDVDDTSMAPSGTNKKITRANVFKGQVIRTEILRLAAPNADAATTYEFTGIDSASYDRLIAVGYNIQSAAANNTDVLFMYMNGDETATNYLVQQIGGNNGTAENNENDAPRIALVAGANAPRPSDFKVEIRGPSLVQVPMATGYYNCWVNAIGEQRVGTYGMTADAGVAAAINSLKFAIDGGEALSGTIILYGERTL